MRTIFLLRHAKAVVSSPDGDFERALAPRGCLQAEKLGLWLATQATTPGTILASPARRTRETANIVAASLNRPLARVDERDLYNAEASEILSIARGVDNAFSTLMIVGHNPGIAELATDLAGRGDKAGRYLMARKFPPCACAILRFDIDSWDELALGKGELSTFVTPKTLDAGEPDDA